MNKKAKLDRKIMRIYLTAHEYSWLPFDRALGEIMRTWDKVEHGLQMIFTLLVQANSKQLVSIFHCSRSVAIKFEMVENSITKNNLNDAEKENLLRILKRLKNLSANRNHLVHAESLTQIDAFNITVRMGNYGSL